MMGGFGLRAHFELLLHSTLEQAEEQERHCEYEMAPAKTPGLVLKLSELETRLLVITVVLGCSGYLTYGLVDC